MDLSKKQIVYLKKSGKGDAAWPLYLRDGKTGEILQVPWLYRMAKGRRTPKDLLVEWKALDAMIGRRNFYHLVQQDPEEARRLDTLFALDGLCYLTAGEDRELVWMTPSFEMRVAYCWRPGVWKERNPAGELSLCEAKLKEWEYVVRVVFRQEQAFEVDAAMWAWEKGLVRGESGSG